VRGTLVRRATSGTTIGSLFRRARDRVLAPQPPHAQVALITALDDVAISISTAQGVHEILATIVEHAKRFTNTEKVLICLVEEFASGLTLDPATLVVRGARDTYAEEWWSARLGEIMDEALADGRPFLQADRESGAWILAVPVRTSAEPLGVLVAINAIDHSLRPEHTAFLSILGALAATSIAHARLAENSRHAMLASERDRIARELHDGIAQSLFSVSLGLELCKKLVVRDQATAVRRLEELQDELGGSMLELRRLVYDLRPVRLKDAGLVGALRAWVRDVTSDRELHGGVRVNGDEYPLTPPQEACLYHVTKEAVSNVARHANAGSFDVEVTFTPEAVVITVADDGDGFDVDAVTSLDDGTGIGLRTMRERVAARSGVLLVRSSPGAGTEVRAWLPVGDRT
jgi:signal transduction histidine kinase